MRRQGQSKKLSEAARLLARGELYTETSSDDADRAEQELDDNLAAFGLVREPDCATRTPEPDPAFYLWPEHVPALELWAGVQTQWRHGFNGPTGLDYPGVRASPAFRRIARRERERVFAEVEVMERAWLHAREELRPAAG